MHVRIANTFTDSRPRQNGDGISERTDDIACWFIDTDYNEENFFVRHDCFLSGNSPYSSPKSKTNAEAWTSLNSDTSNSFNKPKRGRVAVKAINQLGDGVMKVFRVN